MENEIKKKSMLSGIQPSGDLHLGNYLGAVKNWGARAEEFDCYYFMADLHTLTVRQDPKLLRRRSLEQPCSRACGAWLDTQLLHHVRRAEPHDAV